MPEPHPDGYLVKLVRDDVRAMLGGDGQIIYRPMPPGELQPRLTAKLVEEAAEYAVQPCLDELAHVYEVVRGLARHHIGGMAAVIAKADEERAQRGGFELGMGMYAIHPWDRVAAPGSVPTSPAR